ncbi:unnamed protein product [Moneuplotes crassus]|uniref:Uncharacterized protein n=1 Tax=Euplotes crassus TaxID=5936 RepID=A0AAD1XBN5_EUPCR|nr:unnamed protein product [Moneuplotes crassus]
MGKMKALQTIILVIILCILVKSEIEVAQSFEDVNRFLQLNQDVTVALLFIDSSAADQAGSGFLSGVVSSVTHIFSGAEEPSASHQRVAEIEKEISDDAALIQVDISNENLRGVQESYGVTTVPFLVVTKRGIVVLKEAPTRSTHEKILQVLNVSSGSQRDDTASSDVNTEASGEESISGGSSARSVHESGFSSEAVSSSDVGIPHYSEEHSQEHYEENAAHHVAQQASELAEEAISHTETAASNASEHLAGIHGSTDSTDFRGGGEVEETIIETPSVIVQSTTTPESAQAEESTATEWDSSQTSSEDMHSSGTALTLQMEPSGFNGDLIILNDDLTTTSNRPVQPKPRVQPIGITEPGKIFATTIDPNDHSGVPRIFEMPTRPSTIPAMSEPLQSIKPIEQVRLTRKFESAGKPQPIIPVYTEADAEVNIQTQTDSDQEVDSHLEAEAYTDADHSTKDEVNVDAEAHPDLYVQPSINIKPQSTTQVEVHAQTEPVSGQILEPVVDVHLALEREDISERPEAHPESEPTKPQTQTQNEQHEPMMVAPRITLAPGEKPIPVPEPTPISTPELSQVGPQTEPQVVPRRIILAPTDNPVPDSITSVTQTKSVQPIHKHQVQQAPSKPTQSNLAHKAANTIQTQASTIYQQSAHEQSKSQAQQNPTQQAIEGPRTTEPDHLAPDDRRKVVHHHCHNRDGYGDCESLDWRRTPGYIPELEDYEVPEQWWRQGYTPINGANSADEWTKTQREQCEVHSQPVKVEAIEPREVVAHIPESIIVEPVMKPSLEIASYEAQGVAEVSQVYPVRKTLPPARTVQPILYEAEIGLKELSVYQPKSKIYSSSPIIQTPEPQASSSKKNVTSSTTKASYKLPATKVSKPEPTSYKSQTAYSLPKSSPSQAQNLSPNPKTPLLRTKLNPPKTNLLTQPPIQKVPNPPSFPVKSPKIPLVPAPNSPLRPPSTAPVQVAHSSKSIVGQPLGSSLKPEEVQRFKQARSRKEAERDHVQAQLSRFK